jgi:alpha-L-fucosidase
VIPAFKNSVISARLLANGSKVKASVSKDGVLTLTLPALAPDPIATVIRIDVKGNVVASVSTTVKK